MAILTVQEDAPGLTPNFVAAGMDGDSFSNNGSAFIFMDTPAVRRLIVESPHAGLPDFEQDYGPGVAQSPRFDPLRWNNQTTGRLAFHFNTPSGVTIAVVRVGIVGFDPDGGLAGSLV